MGSGLNKAQQQISYRDGYDALKRMLDGFDSVRVGRWLVDEGYWPQMPDDSAGARVRACLSPDKNRFFKFSEILFLAFRTGRPDALHYFCDYTGYERPERNSSAHEQAEHLAEQIRAEERALDAKKNRYKELLVRSAEDTFPSPRGISRLRFFRKRG